MRGGKTNQPSMLMLVSPGSLVPPNHPLRGIKKLADAALKELDATFDAMYSEVGRHSTPPERLLKTLLLRYGGLILFRRAVPLFIGTVVGDMLSEGIWGAVAAWVAMVK